MHTRSSAHLYLKLATKHCNRSCFHSPLVEKHERLYPPSKKASCPQYVRSLHGPPTLLQRKKALAGRHSCLHQCQTTEEMQSMERPSALRPTTSPLQIYICGIHFLLKSIKAKAFVRLTAFQRCIILAERTCTLTTECNTSSRLTKS